MGVFRETAAAIAAAPSEGDRVGMESGHHDTGVPMSLGVDSPSRMHRYMPCCNHGDCVRRTVTSFSPNRGLKVLFTKGPFMQGCQSTRARKAGKPSAMEKLFSAAAGAVAGTMTAWTLGIDKKAGAAAGAIGGSLGGKCPLIFVGAQVGGLAGKKVGKRMAPLLGLSSVQGETMGKYAGMAAGATYARQKCKDMQAGAFECSNAEGNHVTPNVLSSWAYHYGQNAVKASQEAQQHAAHAERMLSQALAARGQAEAAMHEAKLSARSGHAKSDGALVPFYRYCDKIRQYYNEELVGPHEWLRKEPAMVQLRKFCAGLEYAVDREIGAVNAAGLQASGLHMYADPTGNFVKDFCAEPDCNPVWNKEVPTFSGSEFLDGDFFKKLGIKRPPSATQVATSGVDEATIVGTSFLCPLGAKRQNAGRDDIQPLATCAEFL